MIENLFRTIIEISIASSFFVIALLLISPIVKKVYAAKWRYIIWLILAVRLIIPFNITLQSPPVELDMPANIITFRQSDSQQTQISGKETQTTGKEPQIHTPISTEQNLTYSLWEVWFYTTCTVLIDGGL